MSSRYFILSKDFENFVLPNTGFQYLFKYYESLFYTFNQYDTDRVTYPTSVKIKLKINFYYFSILEELEHMEKIVDWIYGSHPLT